MSIAQPWKRILAFMQAIYMFFSQLPLRINELMRVSNSLESVLGSIKDYKMEVVITVFIRGADSRLLNPTAGRVSNTGRFPNR